MLGFPNIYRLSPIAETVAISFYNIKFKSRLKSYKLKELAIRIIASFFNILLSIDCE